MAGNEPENLIRVRRRTYTFNEAVKYMKMKDKEPTIYNIRWYNIKTGKEVIIGYT